MAAHVVVSFNSCSGPGSTSQAKQNYQPHGARPSRAYPKCSLAAASLRVHLSSISCTNQATPSPRRCRRGGGDRRTTPTGGGWGLEVPSAHNKTASNIRTRCDFRPVECDRPARTSVQCQTRVCRSGGFKTHPQDRRSLPRQYSILAVLLLLYVRQNDSNIRKNAKQQRTKQIDAKQDQSRQRKESAT